MRIWGGAAVVLGAGGLVLSRLAPVWWSDTYAAHGLLVVPYSLYVVWSDRFELRGLRVHGDARGLLGLVAGLALLWAGMRESSAVMLGLAMPLLVGGWVLAALGMDYLRALSFPVGFLAFVAPLPRPVVDAFSLHLQRFAAWFGAETASLLGVAVYQQGVTIALPALTLHVAEICNGLRFMSALLVLTVALGHALRLGPARLVVLVGSAVLIAILANGTRILAILLGVQYYGPEAASGIVHHSIGKVVWVLTLVPLGAVAWLLRRQGGTVDGAEGPWPSKAKGV